MIVHWVPTCWSDLDRGIHWCLDRTWQYMRYLRGGLTLTEAVTDVWKGDDGTWGTYVVVWHVQKQSLIRIDELDGDARISDVSEWRSDHLTVLRSIDWSETISKISMHDSFRSLRGVLTVEDLNRSVRWVCTNVSKVCMVSWPLKTGTDHLYVDARGTGVV